MTIEDIRRALRESAAFWGKVGVIGAIAAGHTAGSVGASSWRGASDPRNGLTRWWPSSFGKSWKVSGIGGLG